MNKIILIAIGCFFHASIIFGQTFDPNIELTKTLIFEWGNQSHQIGWSVHSNLTPGSEMHQGPAGFAVNPINKDICIIDIVNGALKIFDSNATFLYEIPVEKLYDSSACELAYDSEGDLWLHHSFERYVMEFSSSGELLRKINYPAPIDNSYFSGEFLIQDNYEFTILSRHFSIPPSNNKTVDATMVGEEYQRPVGKATGRTYETVGTHIYDSGKIIKTTTAIVESDGTEKALDFDEPNTFVSFEKETSNGFSFFRIYPPHESDTSMKLKIFNPALTGNTLLTLGVPNYRNGYEVTFPEHITDDGNIYYLECSDSNIVIKQWKIMGESK